MEYIPAVLHGLAVTLFISVITLLIAVIPGTLLFWGEKSKSKVLFSLATAYIEIFEGIPLLVQLFFFYYALPVINRNFSFSAMTTAIFILTVNAAAHIASLANTESKIIRNPLEFAGYIKVVLLSSILEFGRIIKYTALLSTLGMTELLRSTFSIMNSSLMIGAMLAAVVLYLVMSITVKLIYAGLKKVFFGQEIAV
jgi:His/Glu/Gln/Arg/opine family amino acid ABC transporter permease subunit